MSAKEFVAATVAEMVCLNRLFSAPKHTSPRTYAEGTAARFLIRTRL